jgi:hypothetical protein
LPSAIVFDSHQQKLVFEAGLSSCINDVIFPRKQFVVFEKELDSTSKLAKKVLEDLNKTEEDWSTIKEEVRRKLNRRRNNAQCAVRKMMTSKLCLFVFKVLSKAKI